MEVAARSSPPEERKVIRIGEVPPAKSIAEWTRHGSSRALKFLACLAALVVAFFAWLVVLMGAAVVLFFHLLAAALARGTNATLGAVLTAEAAANSDMASAFGKLLGRAPGPRLAAAEEAKRPASRVS